MTALLALAGLLAGLIVLAFAALQATARGRGPKRGSFGPH